MGETLTIKVGDHSEKEDVIETTGKVEGVETTDKKIPDIVKADVVITFDDGTVKNIPLDDYMNMFLVDMARGVTACAKEMQDNVAKALENKEA